MRFLLTLSCFLFLVNGVLAQNKDSLKTLYELLCKEHGASDSSKCELLSELIDISDDDERFQYSVKLRDIAQYNIDAAKSNPNRIKFFKSYLAWANSNLGDYYKAIGNLSAAVSHFMIAVKLDEEIEAKDYLGSDYNNIGAVFNDMREFDKAIEFYNRSYKVSEEINDYYGKLQVTTNLGSTYLAQNKLKLARSCFQRVLAYSGKPVYMDIRANAFSKLGITYERLGMLYAALSCLHRCAAICDSLIIIDKSLKNIAILSNSYKEMGVCFFKMKNYTEAEKISLKALNLSRENSDAMGIKNASDIAALIYKEVGDFKKALMMRELNMEVSDSLSNEQLRRNSIQKQLQYEMEKKEIIRENEKQKLEITIEQKQIINYILSITVFASIIFISCLLYYRKKYKREEQNKNRQIKFKEELKQEVLEKENIANSLLLIQEREREKLAAELHDGVNQLLFAAKIQLQASKSTSEEMHLDAIKMVETAIEEIRSIAGNQGSFILNGKSLADALNDLIQNMKANQNIQVAFKNYGLDSTKIPGSFQTNILRIIQELLNNAIRHSGATECHIAIKTTHNSVLFSVTDNGCGIDLERNVNGNGTKNIFNKLNLMKGKRRLFTLKNKGTKIYISIPITTNDGKNITG